MKPSTLSSFGGLALLITLVCAGTALAAPSLPITKPPVTISPTNALTGPEADPASAQGQWFMDNAGTESVRSHEFYDDVSGVSMGIAAITGYVNSITYDSASNIVAFSILATIWNDTSAGEVSTFGLNSHGEQLNFAGQVYVGTLFEAKLTASFAITAITNVPASWVSPYSEVLPYIVATNEDQAAWYCWNTNDQTGGHDTPGDYFVPTWDFGDIAIGQSGIRTLDFIVPGSGLDPIDSRYAALEQSFTNKSDVLFNRSLSLKISQWIDSIAADTGEEYAGSDVSVFHDTNGIMEEVLDFGDAPDPTYPTLLASDGARHLVVPGVYMGALIDTEADGQPNATATGDDINKSDDEDGVTFVTPLYLGQSATVDVTCSVSGFLWAWMDFDINGSWAGPPDMIFSNQAVTAGMNNLSFSVPVSATSGTSFARFRFTTQQGTLSYTGLVSDGEVEDYEVTLREEGEEELDFGDAGVGYPTLLANNGARHVIVPGVFMGLQIDAELDGQPHPSAVGDDLANLADEDGVTLPAVFVAGSTVQVAVVASVAGFLNAWIDWNSNTSWADPGEQVFSNLSLSAGINNLAVLVPLTVVAGGPHSRWRFTTYAPPIPAFTGAESDGEVEDHEVRLEVLDFGDAPDPAYPTLLVNDGARHRTPSGYYLGALIDADPEGRPSANADGDDVDNLADEDGVIPQGNFVLGQTNVLQVTASTNGYFDGWIDFNRDGDWSDAGENMVSGLALTQGVNYVNAAVPLGASVGETYARVRFSSSAAGLLPTGMATDGEVEDYKITIYQQGPSTNIVITKLVRTGQVARIRWTATNDVTYETQATTNQLKDTNISWQAIGGTVVGPVNEQAETNPAGRLRMYRVVAPYAPPPGP
ncbi:MAG: hypothetical protein KJ726_05755 [Verrucomicrobia bacterium]|nr:hypothetical protein [Verrucomicrobiota bacterium]